MQAGEPFEKVSLVAGYAVTIYTTEVGIRGWCVPLLGRFLKQKLIF